ncbi:MULTISPECIES: hypothetical protein [Chryseobacterium]|nr:MULTISPECIES: hypothetical protein [Chryseobacterium]MDR6923082.1 hypothetical protein [Chryseobacterium sp. 2987]
MYSLFPDIYTKTKRLEFTGKDFLLIRENGGKTPLILELCN